MADNEETQRATRQKRIAIETRVSGKFGDFIDDPLSAGRRKRARIYGVVVQAIDSRKYKVLFDNGTTTECYSNSLRVESATSTPPDLPPLPDPRAAPPLPSSTSNEAEVPPIPRPEEEEESVTEHMPVHDPGTDDLSETEPNEDDQMPVGALPGSTEVGDVSRRYHEMKDSAKRRIAAMLGRTAREKSGNKSVLWTVIEDHLPSDLIHPRASDKPMGLKNIETIKKQPKNMILASLFLELMFQDRESIKESVRRMNFHIQAERKSKVKTFSAEEFLTCIGLLIGSCQFETQGKKCWRAADHGKPEEEEDYLSLVQHPNFDRFLPYSRFKDFRRFLPSIWYDEEKREANDPWWKFAAAVESFNSVRKNEKKPMGYH